MQFKIAVLQINSTTDKERNLSKLSQLIREASVNDIKLISLPEMMNAITNEPMEAAESIPGYTTDILISLAKEYGVWIHGGSIAESNKNEKPYNTTVMISPDRGIIAKYRKLHLFDVDLPSGRSIKESNKMTAGDQIVTVDTEIGNLGFAICYDIRFPEIFRIMALKGAQIVFTPANFTYETGSAHWESILRCRAIENGYYIVAAGQCGVNSSFRAYGHSMVIDPYGRILSLLENEEGILYAVIDTDYVKRMRGQIPSLNNRRTDIY